MRLYVEAPFADQALKEADAVYHAILRGGIPLAVVAPTIPWLDQKPPKGPCAQINSIYFGRKRLPIWVLWVQSIYYLGTWTLRDP